MMVLAFDPLQWSEKNNHGDYKNGGMLMIFTPLYLSGTDLIKKDNINLFIYIYSQDSILGH